MLLVDAAVINGAILELVARIVPEYALAIPEANITRSVSLDGREPEENTSFGVKRTQPEFVCPWR